MKMTAHQTIIDDELRWSASTVAQDGRPVEEDGWGLPPARVRNEILDKDGAWSLIVVRSASKAAVAKVLRNALSLSLSETAELLKSVPGTIYTGTETEAKWLAKRLERVGAILSIKSCTSNVIPAD